MNKHASDPVHDSLQRTREGHFNDLKTLKIDVDLKEIFGNSVTISDFSIVTSIKAFYVVPVDPETYSNIVTWIRRVEQLLFYDVCKKNLEGIKTSSRKN
ncbi:hypothetical protein BDFB_009999 [Asbolus verrucosus]|uniref:GST C domain containing protein n=1 Tax=Asbolus verrucosus TaxID=1661398 RepID=A0A482VNT3_ASBVE|nr:hypothetical protein BDFB_009999 [Asbolus verrucosus]